MSCRPPGCLTHSLHTEVMNSVVVGRLGSIGLSPRLTSACSGVSGCLPSLPYRANTGRHGRYCHLSISSSARDITDLRLAAPRMALSQLMAKSADSLVCVVWHVNTPTFLYCLPTALVSCHLFAFLSFAFNISSVFPQSVDTSFLPPSQN